MKRLFVLFIFLAGGRLGFGQGDSQDPYAEKLVSSLVTATGTLVIYSMQEKAVNRLGDRAAVGLIRHVGAQAPVTSLELEHILGVLKMAFAAPETITSDVDREPKATLVLLAYLNYLPASGNSKGEIEQTRSYVVQQMNDYKLKHERQKN